MISLAHSRTGVRVSTDGCGLQVVPTILDEKNGFHGT